MITNPITVRPELVEGLHFFSAVEKKEQCFDKLSTNGIFTLENAK